MSTFRTEELTCPVCGKTFSAPVLLSFTSFGAFRELDGNPHAPEIYDTIQMCPACGYVSSDFRKEPDLHTMEIVKSPEYQKIFCNDLYSGTARKLLLAGSLEEQKDDPTAAGLWYLRAYWYFRDQGTGDAERAAAPMARDRAIEMLRMHLERHADKNAAMVLIDLLRQKQEFTDARDGVIALEDYLENDEILLRIASFERELIAAGDAGPHLLSEVTT